MAKRAILFLIRVYRRYISPLFPPCCRFYPTCSTYAMQAVEKYGALKGGWLAVKRILRCNPFNDGGYDPVPWPNLRIAENIKNPKTFVRTFRHRRNKQK